MGRLSTARILCIEDDEDAAAQFKAIVQGRGFPVDLATKGGDGLRMHAAAPYDIVAVHHRLPDMTGSEVCRRLLLDDPDLAIVMMVESGGEEIAARARVRCFELPHQARRPNRSKAALRRN